MTFILLPIASLSFEKGDSALDILKEGFFA